MTQSPDPDLIRPASDDAPLPLNGPADSTDPSVIALPRRTTGVWPLAGLALAVALFLGGGYYLLSNRGPQPAADTAPPPAPVATPTAPLGSNPFPAEVPPLDLSDAFVRTWVPRLSAHPSIARWLATDGLIRNFTTVVVNIADGQTPAGRVASLNPGGSFAVLARGDALVIDPRSYGRYDALAAAFASLDPALSAQLYATLKPRIEEAHAELGAPPGSFDRTIERAIVALLQTPIPDGPVAVEPAGIGYRFVDDRLESLSDAQRHLIRMGPQNARLVQRGLRDLALALGIPASRLPTPAS